jgi:hypothetical protein
MVRILLIATLLCFNTKLFSQEHIEGAFGINLGEEFDTTKAIGKGSLTDGTIMYMFNSSKPFRSFSKYYVLITPKTNKVYGIWAIGDIESDPMCEKEQDLLMSILTKKYGKPENTNSMFSFMDTETIQNGNRTIITKCSGYSDVSIDIRYYDNNLKSIAEKERIELESEKLDASGL